LSRPISRTIPPISDPLSSGPSPRGDGSNPDVPGRSFAPRRSRHAASGQRPSGFLLAGRGRLGEVSAR
jgi:hypothetical protein